MQLKVTALAILAALSATVLASPSAMTVKVTYDETYDSPNGSLNDVACSDGENGLVTRGFTTFSSLPVFPFVGGAQFVSGWNSAECGSCWTLTYEGASINVVAVDTAGTGFSVAKEPLQALGG